MDAREATKKVKEYLSEVKGVEPLAFDVEKAIFNKNKKEWVIECSFYRNPLEIKRMCLTIIVDESGSIKELKPNGK